MMTLQEAIEHLDEVIEAGCGNEQCRLEHIQLRDWLEELLHIREARDNQPKLRVLLARTNYDPCTAWTEHKLLDLPITPEIREAAGTDKECHVVGGMYET